MRHILQCDFTFHNVILYLMFFILLRLFQVIAAISHSGTLSQSVTIFHNFAFTSCECNFIFYNVTLYFAMSFISYCNFFHIIATIVELFLVIYILQCHLIIAYRNFM